MKKLFLFLVAISLSFSSFANPFEILGVKSGMTKDEVKKISNLKESYGMIQLDLKNKNSFFDIERFKLLHVSFTTASNCPQKASSNCKCASER